MSIPSRGCNRLYSQTALEAWFATIQHEWEREFSEEALKRGQAIYVEGQVSELELSGESAIVHCRFSRKDTCYAVIEWDRRKGRLDVRSSTEDTALGRAVAAAGLYEIEELLADEIPAVAAEGDGGVEHGESDAPAPTEEAEAVPVEAKPAVEEKPARALLLRLSAAPGGLHLKAFWKQPGQPVAVFSKGGETRARQEREYLVRLTALAHDDGFVYRQESHDFLMRQPERMDSFLKRRLKVWESIFGKIETDAEVRRMQQGIREVDLVARVEAAGQDSVRLDWRLRSGDDWLDDFEISRLPRNAPGVHMVRGVGLIRVSKEMSHALNEWQAPADGQRWPRYMLFSLFGDRGMSLDLDRELERWRDRLYTNGTSTQLPDLPAFLRHYQAYGVTWLANLKRRHCHGLLADEMGLGKTLQVLTLLRYAPYKGKPALIVCPASVVPVWSGEIARWYPEMNVAVLKTDCTFADAPDPEPAVWIASYTQLRRHKSLLEQVRFGYAILDEAQHIKNPDAKVTHACCAIRARTRIALTGTPLENRLLDIWTIFRFLMPGLLGSRRRFEEAVAQGGPSAQAAFAEKLRVQLSPFVLRRTKDEVGTDLPPKLEMDLVCPISEVQRQAYQRLLEEGRSEMGDDLEAAMRNQTMHFFSLLTRLRQACCDPGLIPDVDADIMQSGKVQLLVDKLEEALTGEGSRKVVVFSQFVKMLKRLKKLLRTHFPEIDLMELNGSTQDRSKPVEAFQTSEKPAIILVSLKAGGTGITLHAADYVFLLDPWWNPAVEMQAVDRVHRIGQEKHVFVYRMITRGTIEERIQLLKREKRALFEDTIGQIGKASDLKEHFEDLKGLAALLPT